MSEKIDCLLDKFHNLQVRIAKLKHKSRVIKDQILKEAEIESRQNATEQPRS